MGTISSVSAALRVLETLSSEAAEISSADVQRLSQIEKSVLSRIVTTLEQDGYVRRNPKNDLLSLTIKYPSAALRFLEHTGLLQASVPVLQEIANQTGELVQLAISEGGPPIYLAKAAGRNRIQALPLIGTQAVAYASTAGKLWLASLDDFDLMAFMRNMKLSSMTNFTKTDRTEILKDVKAARKAGYAVINAELSEDVSALGVPLTSSDTGEFLGALCISMPTYRATQGALLRHLPLLQARANAFVAIIQYSRLALSSHVVPSQNSKTPVE
jgi:DNA-binding IclR family transcriptional regulator